MLAKQIQKKTLPLLISKLPTLSNKQQSQISSYKVGSDYTRADIIRKKGTDLVHEPLYFKGLGYTQSERDRLNLRGLIPPGYMSIEAQAELLMLDINEGDEQHRGDEQILKSNGIDKDNIRKWKVLQSIHDRNETLFYKILDQNFEEMAPIIYTPTVGWVCKNYSQIFRRPRGMYFSAKDKNEMAIMVRNWQSNEVDAIVITDGSRVLGLGDLGINGIGISIGKLDLYVAAGGFHPARVLPIVFDVGTNNVEVRNNPSYIGLRQPRLDGDEYYELLDELMSAIYLRWPNALVQFEDFQMKHAIATLRRYRDHYLMFNDDIQGTAATVLAGLFGSLKLLGRKPQDIGNLKIVMVGAGSAGSGAALQITKAMTLSTKQSQTQVAKNFWIHDKNGLITHARTNFDELQDSFTDLQDFAKSGSETRLEGESLVDTIKRVQPDVLIGLSGVGGVFSQEVIEQMSLHCDRPIIMPLSNPTAQAECTHEQAIKWSQGKAIFSSGSPFPPVEYNGKTYYASQCNNKYIFPGLALGAMLSQCGKITDEMITMSALALSDLLEESDLQKGMIFPQLKHPKQISSYVATKVIFEAQRNGLKIGNDKLKEQMTDFNTLRRFVRRKQWLPQYRNLIHIPQGVSE
ncbi:hypothetical protein PPERSA_02614 [Pseudocohnilembus persalinus]|uniref:Malic enzyme n=1 Tax=Pseudocohnilembus persalinus TaxID=266149 RepID=A0A0V0R5J1_PSEPJ|nr:hypothetical protein PPERSA_02614 [Pseudocohnilembus persalinus]|eukprot:KRX09742.1 hypothetical protein PPERSA_02614 [Pseudocohnilembus persalinus]